MITTLQLSEYDAPVLAQTLVSLPWEDCPISLALNVLGHGLQTTAIRRTRLGYISGDCRKWRSIEYLDTPCGITIDRRDEAGKKAAQRLMRLSLRFRELRVPHGKDISEFYLSGGDVYAWVAEATGEIQPLLEGDSNGR